MNRLRERERESKQECHNETRPRNKRVHQRGFIDQGNGKIHQQNIVYGADGLAPCLSATDYKHKVNVIKDE